MKIEVYFMLYDSAFKFSLNDTLFTPNIQTLGLDDPPIHTYFDLSQRLGHPLRVKFEKNSQF